MGAATVAVAPRPVGRQPRARVDDVMERFAGGRVPAPDGRARRRAMAPRLERGDLADPNSGWHRAVLGQKDPPATLGGDGRRRAMIAAEAQTGRRRGPSPASSADDTRRYRTRAPCPVEPRSSSTPRAIRTRRGPRDRARGRHPGTASKRHLSGAPSSAKLGEVEVVADEAHRRPTVGSTAPSVQRAASIAVSSASARSAETGLACSGSAWNRRSSESGRNRL